MVLVEVVRGASDGRDGDIGGQVEAVMMVGVVTVG